MYILANDIFDEEKQVAMDEIASVITAHGEITKTDKCGVRKYAYPIDFKSEGFYGCLEFKSEAEVPVEIKRLETLSDSIIRTLILRK